MSFKIITIKRVSIFLVLVIFGTLMFSACRRTRYKHMVKKRRAGTMKKSRYKGEYQRKLRKKTISVESPYYIKKKKDFKRRPWYDAK